MGSTAGRDEPTRSHSALEHLVDHGYMGANVVDRLHALADADPGLRPPATDGPGPGPGPGPREDPPERHPDPVRPG